MSRRAALAVAVPAILVPAALFALLEPSPIPPPVEHSRASAPSRSLAYARLLARHVREGTIDGATLRVVDYAAIPGDPDYARALAELAEARPEAMGREERMAYWINAYNLLAIRLVVDRYPIASILDVHEGHEGAFEMEAGSAGGRAVSLSWIHDTLREMGDPRIHFALVAAAVSCPDLRAYDSASLDAQLEAAARAFLANDRRGARATSEGVEVSRLLLSSHREFERGGGLIAFLRSHAPPGVAERLESSGLHDLGKLPYDWSLNDLARTSVARRD
ncbi:MAG TPA: DUF547 domain-containing protein [Gemmatimonadota bacterium]|nr:DUF547 domain-containing protein [Gemmatimonadota bacterium]